MLDSLLAKGIKEGLEVDDDVKRTLLIKILGQAIEKVVDNEIIT